jgi:hypothetical protein
MHSQIVSVTGRCVATWCLGRNFRFGPLTWADCTLNPALDTTNLPPVSIGSLAHPRRCPVQIVVHRGGQAARRTRKETAKLETHRAKKHADRSKECTCQVRSEEASEKQPHPCKERKEEQPKLLLEQQRWGHPPCSVSTCGDGLRRGYASRFRRKPIPISPTRPVPSRSMLEGSGAVMVSVRLALFEVESAHVSPSLSVTSSSAGSV